MIAVSTSPYRLYHQWNRLLANSLALNAILQEDFFGELVTVWIKSRAAQTRYIIHCLGSDKQVSMPTHHACHFGLGASGIERTSALRLTEVTFQTPWFQMSLCMLIFFSPPFSPSPGCYGNRSWGFGKKKKKKKKEAFKELPTFTDKFLDPFAPYFFIFILQSKCFSFFLFFSPFQPSSIFPAVFRCCLK